MAQNTNRAADIRAARELVKSLVRQAEAFEAQSEVALTRAAEVRRQAENLIATFGL